MDGDIYKKHRRVLLSTIDGDEIIVESLYSEGILNERQYQQIKYEKVPIRAAELMLNFLQHAGLRAFRKFCEILESDYSWLADQLKVEAQKAGIDLKYKDEDCCENIILPSRTEKMVPSEHQLMNLCQTLIRNSWESVLYELGLLAADIDQCKISHSLEKLQCKRGLTLWKRRNGQSATFKTLFAACENADVDNDCLSLLVSIAAKSET